MSFFIRGMLLTLIGGVVLTTAARFYSQQVMIDQRGKRVVVSLGALPSQLSSMQPLLKSLIDKQGFKPNMVYLVLPRKRPDGEMLEYEIPDSVDDYVKQKKITLLRPKVAYGNATKLLAALRYENAGSRIIYMEDDHEAVGRNFISSFLQQSLHYPDAAIAFSGANLHSYFRSLISVESTKHPKAVDILQGSAIMVQRRFFKADAFKELVQEAPDVVRSADKFLISAHLEEQQVRRWVVPQTGSRRRKSDRSFDGEQQTSMKSLTAIHYLQQQLGIWKGYKFHNPKKLSDDEKDAIKCDTGDKSACHDDYKNILKGLDSKSK